MSLLFYYYCTFYSKIWKNIFRRIHKSFDPICSRPDKRDKHFVHDTNTTMNTSWNKLGDMYITDIITEWHTFSFTMLFFKRIHNKILQIVGIFHFWNTICTFLTCYWMFLQIRYIETIIVPIKKKYSLIQFKGYNSKFKFFDGVQFRKYFISLPAFYLIIWLMESPKNFEKTSILKIWQLVFFRVVKTGFGEK